MHARKQIRDAAVDLLKANGPSKWKHVYNRRVPISRDALPYLLVYIDSEVSDDATFHPVPILNRDPDRVALLLRAEHALPYAEVARVLEISEGAARVKVHRARRRLLETRLTNHGGT